MHRLILALFALALATSTTLGQWQQQTSGTDAGLRGHSVVSPSVVWAGGTKGTVLRTVDGGKKWSVAFAPAPEKLDFRDVKAFSDKTAYMLSAGPGEESRIYKTTDGGANWELQFKNLDKDAFFDAMAFWDEKHGIALSDPVKGRFPLIVTEDGVNWKPLLEKSLPESIASEGCFAASGTCLITQGDSDVWFGTGGGKTARVFHSSDRGKNWTVTDTPLLAGIASGGIFSIAFRDREHGIIVGGDYKGPNETNGTVAITSDGGKTWKGIEKPLPFRSCVAWAKDRWIAVGTSGSDFSVDNGKTWKSLDSENYNSVASTSAGDCWAFGPKGRIAKFEKPK